DRRSAHCSHGTQRAQGRRNQRTIIGGRPRRSPSQAEAQVSEMEAKAADADNNMKSNPDGAAASTTVFEIVNDEDRVWVSTDGKTWKAK
ncbi:MAG: hypothetical protein ABSD96_22715, partial [Candidatus Korobacteraceae bacterium]